MGVGDKMASNLETIKEMGKKTGMAGKIILGYGLRCAYSAPTATRIALEKQGEELEINFENLLAGTCLYALSQMIINIPLHQGINEEYRHILIIGNLSVSVATNIASGLYEWFRYEKNKSSTISPATAISPQSTLETTVETPEAPKITPTIPDQRIEPWKPEIPKMDATVYTGRER
jgi:hypothetical protein